MTPIILVLMSIALFAIFLTLGMNSLNIDRIKSSSYVSELKMALPSMEMSINNYKNINGELPSELEWKEEVFPDYGNIPSLSFSGTWIYKNIGGINYICLESPYREDLAFAFVNLENNHSYAFKKGTSCGFSEEFIDSENIVLSYSF